MNRGIKVLQTSALPLGYVATSMPIISAKLCSFCFYRPQSALLRSAVDLAIRIRLELTTSSVTGWHSNQLNYRTVLVGVTGLEPVTPCL